MSDLAALQRAERRVALVRAVAVLTALVHLVWISDRAGGASALVGLLIAVLVLVGVAAEIAGRSVDGPRLERLGALFLTVDALAVVGIVWLERGSPAAAGLEAWVLLTLVPLEAALRFRLAGAIAGWAVAASAYVAAATAAARAPHLMLSHLALLLMVALFAGAVTRDVHEQRRQLEQVIASTQRIASRLEPAEILQTLAREARRCLGAASAVVYAYDGEWFQPVASCPAEALLTVLEEEREDEVNPALARRLLERPLWLEPDVQHVGRLSVPLRWRAEETEHLLVVRPYARTPGGFETAIAVSLAESAALALSTNRVLASEQRSNRRLRYLEAFRARFVATLAHDLRLPLTVFKGVAQALRARPSALTHEQVDALLDNVERQANRLNHLADDLLDAARLDSGKLVLHRERCDLEALVADATADLGEQVEVDVEPGLTVEVDAARLERVLWNLLANAVKYGRPPFELSARRDGDHVAIAVRDHGPGIEPLRRARLFEDFATGGDDAGSVGLGLAVIRQLVEAHGGEVAYEDAAPGARFVIRLPVVTAAVHARVERAATAGE